MATSNHRMLMAIGSGAVLMATLQGCVPSPRPAPRTDPGPGRLIIGVPVWYTQERDAEGGGRVTVDYGIVPGVMPQERMKPGPDDTVAWFSNRGERGKKEKRYAWKPRIQAEYVLVLSYDRTGTGRTKWTMREHSLVGGRPHSIEVKSGHLWRCTGPDHLPDKKYRDVGFKDCLLDKIPYDPSETASDLQGAIVRFASHTTEGEGRLNPTGPGWISCDGGCCSLGQ